MKIVREHINEVLSFKRDQENSLTSYSVGKIHLIKTWLDEMGVKNYIINDDLTIDVKGNLDLSFKIENKFPDFIKFNKIKGNFWIDHNELISLEGCPKYVFGGFSCSNNQLTNLEGCPTLVGGSFDCYFNKVKFNKKEVLKYCKVNPDNIYV